MAPALTPSWEGEDADPALSALDDADFVKLRNTI